MTVRQPGLTSQTLQLRHAPEKASVNRSVIEKGCHMSFRVIGHLDGQLPQHDLLPHPHLSCHLFLSQPHPMYMTKWLAGCMYCICQCKSALGHHWSFIT